MPGVECRFSSGGFVTRPPRRNSHKRVRGSPSVAGITRLARSIMGSSQVTAPLRTRPNCSEACSPRLSATERRNSITPTRVASKLSGNVKTTMPDGFKNSCPSGLAITLPFCKNHDLHPFKLPIDIANVRFFQHSNIIWLVKSFYLGNIFSHINYRFACFQLPCNQYNNLLLHSLQGTMFSIVKSQYKQCFLS